MVITVFSGRTDYLSFMKRLLLITTFFLATPPAFPKAILYLKCKVTADVLITDLATSKIVEDRTIDDISILKIDFEASTAHDVRSEEAVDIVTEGEKALIAQRINDNEVKFEDDSNLHLRPPYSFSGVGKTAYKSKTQKANYTYQGSCIEVDASVFDKALNQQNL